MAPTFVKKLCTPNIQNLHRKSLKSHREGLCSSDGVDIEQFPKCNASKHVGW